MDSISVRFGRRVSEENKKTPPSRKVKGQRRPECSFISHREDGDGFK